MLKTNIVEGYEIVMLGMHAFLCFCISSALNLAVHQPGKWKKQSKHNKCT